MRGEDRSKQIAQMRREMGLTQRELAEQLRTTNGSISEWERGFVSPQPYYWKALVALYHQHMESGPHDGTAETTHL